MKKTYSISGRLRFLVYNLLRLTTFFGSKALLFKVKVKGRHNIPKKDAYIIASNHVGHLDPYILGTIFPRHMCYMTNPGQFKMPLWGRTLAFIETIDAGGFSGMRIALKRLGEGRIVVFFPQGERVKNTIIESAKPGVGASALWTGLEVLPVRISGTDTALNIRTAVIRPGSIIEVIIGEPMKFDSLDYEGRISKSARKVTDVIVKKINSLADANV
ncbi:MAG: 1-acyl-sn-glycerol-3-phosphate acyltransferase [Candidatus Omnitrophica bacterium]|nr:1-acyl-sn-glycerol-3-phosphate acyltransferase [Candidatus Omnitrophota bacterium]